MIVTGAGIIGLACAWRLRQKGFKVTIFDAREPASEASWAAAGMLAPGGEIDRDSALAILAMRSLRGYPDFVRELGQDTGMPIDFRQCGAFEVAATSEEFEALCAKAERQRAAGIESERATYGAMEARFYAADAMVDPRQVNAALRRACERMGCVVRASEPVEEIAPDGTSVRTARETLFDDDGVLIAAGAWSSSLCAALPPTKPVRGHLAAWSLKPGTLPSIVRRGHTYLLQRSGGTLIAGSSTEDAGFNREIDGAVVADIRERAAKLLPALAGVAPDQCWNGFRPAIDSANAAPIIGKIGERLWAAVGHYRNGILLAPETAKMIAASIDRS